MLDDSISSLFPDLFGMSRPIATPDVPVIVAASMLTTYDAPMLPVTKVGTPPGVEKNGVKLYHAVGSLPIVSLLLRTDPRDYYKTLWNSCSSTTILIGTVRYDDPLEKLLEVFALTGFGDARVDGASPPPALLTLNEVASLYKERAITCRALAKEVASPAITIDPSFKAIHAMTLMSEKRVRRLFLKGRKGDFVSDRTILSALFSPKGLKVARDDPGSWTDVRLSDIPPAKAHLVSPDAMVEDVAALIEPGREVFMTSDGAGVLSRWDLVMKPWKAGKLRLGMVAQRALEPTKA
ncbi:MAG TPA: hypothetical protein VLX56_06475 [Nitrososphaerales archaeon]|nr:hypothetical protein [Nitrososphaerales archaeon]